jgi:hypothetical protein
MPEMKDIAKQLVRSQDIATRVAQVMQKRMDSARQRFNDRVQAAYRRASWSSSAGGAASTS